MIDRDDADEFGRALVDELMSTVDEILFKKHIEQQIVPYTLHTVSNNVLDIVDVSIQSPPTNILDYNHDFYRLGFDLSCS